MGNMFFKDDVLFDSHAHLCDTSFDNDRDDVVSRAKENEVERIVDISVDMSTVRRAVENAKVFQGVVYASVGIDMECLVPGSELFSKELFQLSDNDWSKRLEEIKSELLTLIQANMEHVVCIGETGLDHYWLGKAVSNGAESEIIVSDEDSRKSKKRQEDLFCMHLELAEVTDLPLSIHSRGAEDKCVEIVKRYPKTKGVFHSYTGSLETAKRVLDNGWGLGVNGIVTFEKADEMREMYRKIVGRVSSDWSIEDYYTRGIYFETDSPYLAPKGKRGERNEPGNLLSIYSEFIRILQ